MRQGPSPMLTTAPYDTGAAFDVIEHVPDPEGFLSHIAAGCQKVARWCSRANRASPWAASLGSRWWF